MKKILLYLILFMSAAFINAQTARTFFPQNTGYKWYFEVFPLDSLNNPVTSLAYVQADSFASTGSYLGKDAEIVLSKTGTESTINFLPYTDTSYYSFEASNGWVYYKIGGLDSLIGILDTSLVNLLQSFENWYPVYRFNQTVNTNYDIFSFDTLLVINSTPAQMRFKLEGRRFQDENLQTAIGTFNTKKFRLTSKIIYLLLGIIPITIVERGDTTWIAEDNWIVKSFAPSANVDLSFIGAGSFTIPGLKYDIAEPQPTSVSDFPSLPEDYILRQNYPNPFNPSTKIVYGIPVSGVTLLKVYDVLGNEIAVLVNQTQAAGMYEVDFNASGLSSGIYYYRLNSGNFTRTGKMIYMR
jgi:hypothetical protein